MTLTTAVPPNKLFEDLNVQLSLFVQDNPSVIDFPFIDACLDLLKEHSTGDRVEINFWTSLSEIVDKIEKLNPNIDPSVSSIRKKAHSIFDIQKNPSVSEALAPSRLYQILSYAPQVVTSYVGIFTQTFQDTFVDGNFPWKYRKYELEMKAIRMAFKTHSQKSLKDIKAEFLKHPESPLQIKVIEVINTLLKENVSKCSDYRGAYRSFLKTLRLALTSSEFTNARSIHSKLKFKEENLDLFNPHVQFLLDICTYLFTEVHIHSFCEQLISWVISLGIKNLPSKKQSEYAQWLNQDPLTLPLNIQFDAIDAAPQECKSPLINQFLSKVRGGLGIGYDPQLDGNIPFVLYDFQLKQSDDSIKTIRVIRTCTPTKQRDDLTSCTYEGEATIIPEFENFLEGKKVLFVSLQDDAERAIGNESKRNVAFKLHHKKNPLNFFLGILSHDSHFYNQTGPYEDIDSKTPFFAKALDFKEACIDIMMKGREYYFPEEWKSDETFIDELKQSWDEIHEDLFEKKEQLFKAERQVFIDIYYVRIIFSFLKRSGAEYLIFCCKDSKDRAAKFNSLFFKYMLTIFEKEQAREKMFKTFVHAPSFIAKKNAMNFRKFRLMSADAILSSMGVMERIRRRKDAIGLVGDDIMVKESDKQRIN